MAIMYCEMEIHIDIGLLYFHRIILNLNCYFKLYYSKLS